MNKRELARSVAERMRENGIRKVVSAKKHVLHISDDSGNTSDFVLRDPGKKVMFTTEDIEYIVDVLVEVIQDAIKVGEPISIRGFGTLFLQYRKARRTKHPDTGEEVDVADRYVPKFKYGNNLRMCAKAFELAADEVDWRNSRCTYEEDDEDFFGGDE